jgi:hypothetical protein
MLWYPTQAKTGLEWGTQPSLTVKQSKKGHKLSGSDRICLDKEKKKWTDEKHPKESQRLLNSAALLMDWISSPGLPLEI